MEVGDKRVGYQLFWEYDLNPKHYDVNTNYKKPLSSVLI